MADIAECWVGLAFQYWIPGDKWEGFWEQIATPTYFQFVSETKPANKKKQEQWQQPDPILTKIMNSGIRFLNKQVPGTCWNFKHLNISCRGKLKASISILNKGMIKCKRGADSWRGDFCSFSYTIWNSLYWPISTSTEGLVYLHLISLKVFLLRCPQNVKIHLSYEKHYSAKTKEKCKKSIPKLPFLWTFNLGTS